MARPHTTNGFVRHRNAGQQGEYDQAFLDWIPPVVPRHGRAAQPADRVAEPT